jgi:hypothetical protein
VALIVVVVALSAWLGDFAWPWLVALVVLALIGLAVVMRLPENPDTALSDAIALQSEEPVLARENAASDR